MGRLVQAGCGWRRPRGPGGVVGMAETMINAYTVLLLQHHYHLKVKNHGQTFCLWQLISNSRHKSSKPFIINSSQNAYTDLARQLLI
jgi:hypothetical protein